MAAALVLTAAAPSACSGRDDPPESPPSREAARQSDLDGLVRAVETLHPDPFGALDESAWRRDVARLRERAPHLTADEFLVGVARVAVLGERNGHGGLFPTDQRGLRMWPLRLHEFPDGWYVVDTSIPELRGARLDGIGGRPVDEVVAALAPIVPRDNGHSLRARLGTYLVVPAFLRGLGVLGDGSLGVTLPGGRTTTVRPDAVPSASYADLTGIVVPQIPLTLPRPEEAPPDDFFWWRRDRGALVVGYERVLGESPDGGTVQDFVAELEAEVSRSRPRALVLDVRRNPGGENEQGDRLMAFLRDVAASGVPVRVLVGRGTYSAAALLLAELREHVSVTVYGEPSGGGSGTFGNPAVHRLTASGVVVQVPGRWFSRLAEDVPAVEPDVPVDTTWPAWSAGRDEVLEAALR